MQHRIFALLTIGALGAACASNPTEPQPGPAVRLTLVQGEQQSPYTGFRVTLIAVENDSRCPATVQCVWQGDAEVHLGFSTDSLMLTVPVVLHTGVEPRVAVAHGYEIRLDSLKPGTNPDAPIAQSEYRGYVSVARLKVED